MPRDAFHAERFARRWDVPRGTELIDSVGSSAKLARILLEGLEEIPCSASQDQQESLLRLARLLASWAKNLNLTSHRTPESIVRRLILDAAALLRALPDFRSLVDLGAGAGFPALPAAILGPGRRVLLVESRERRHHFQRAAVRELHLENVALRRGRIEELPPEPGEIVVAQAVGPAPKIVRWMLPWAEPGGLLVIPGGSSPPDPRAGDEVRDERVLRYRVPLGGPWRTLWLGRAP